MKQFFKQSVHCVFAVMLTVVLVFASGRSVKAVENINPLVQPVCAVSSILINTATEQVVAYDWSNSPIIVFSCSTGAHGNTYVGTYRTSNYYEWKLMNGNCWARYAVRFNNHELMHSVPYYRCSPDSLEYNQYNRLGTPASSGCCRLALCDAKWIYENTIPGTVVRVVKDPNLIYPLSRPNIIIDVKNAAIRGWDPTDTDPRSPYMQLNAGAVAGN